MWSSRCIFFVKYYRTGRSVLLDTSCFHVRNKFSISLHTTRGEQVVLTAAEQIQKIASLLGPIFRRRTQRKNMKIKSLSIQRFYAAMYISSTTETDFRSPFLSSIQRRGAIYELEPHEAKAKCASKHFRLFLMTF
jgi:hypothetical protein